MDNQNTTQITKPVLIVGIGSVGSKIAYDAKKSLNFDCLFVSHDKKDLCGDGCSNIEISTESIINPSVQLLRGFALKKEAIQQIKDKISGYSSIVLVCNLAGKAGAAIAPVISNIAKKDKKTLVSFAVMPFGYEKDRIFSSGVSLKRLKEDSSCTIVLDNDAILDSNPDLTPKKYYEITNSAILHVISSLAVSSEITGDVNIISSSRNYHDDLEASLRDSLKMLYQSAPNDRVKRSMIYVMGGDNIPIQMLDSIQKITSSISDKQTTRVDMSTNSSDHSKVVMLSAVSGETRFDKYDPLGMIPKEDTLDWDEPDCVMDCKLDLYQIDQ
jgi:cell division protein FtsZ